MKRNYKLKLEITLQIILIINLIIISLKQKLISLKHYKKIIAKNISQDLNLKIPNSQFSAKRASYQFEKFYQHFVFLTKSIKMQKLKVTVSHSLAQF